MLGRIQAFQQSYILLTNFTIYPSKQVYFFSIVLIIFADMTFSQYLQEFSEFYILTSIENVIFLKRDKSQNLSRNLEV